MRLNCTASCSTPIRTSFETAHSFRPDSPRFPKSKAMNVFRHFRDRVRDSVITLSDAGMLPDGLNTDRITVEAPRDPSHGDLSTNAAMVLAKPAGMKPRGCFAADRARQAAAGDRSRHRRARLHQSAPCRRLLAGAAQGHPSCRQSLWRERDGQRRQSQCRVRLCQPDRAAAHRPCARCGDR